MSKQIELLDLIGKYVNGLTALDIQRKWRVWSGVHG